MLVEDNPDFQAIVGRWLAPHHDFVACSNGDELFEEVESARPDLVVLDVDLPGPSGFELCRRLRAISCFARLPIVFLTGSSRIEDFLQSLADGGDLFLTKPITRKALLDAIERTLPED